MALAGIKLREHAEAEAEISGRVVLIVFDADGEFAGEVAPRVLAQARARAGGCQVSVVVAVQEFEAWFLADLTGLKQRYPGLFREEAAPPKDPERVRDAKGVLRRSLKTGTCAAAVDQVRFAAALDPARARLHSPSFDKLCREVEGWGPTGLG